MRWIILLVLLSLRVFACDVLENNAVINGSVKLCNDVFYLDDGIAIVGSNIVLDCAGAIIRGSYEGAGITIIGKGIIVKNCRILNYESAFLVTNSSRVFLLDNHLVRNVVGVSFCNVFCSAVFNYDISLDMPLSVVKSSGNVLSSKNRFLEGAFCSDNFCNRPRHVVELYMAPKNDAYKFNSWFLSNLIPRESLHGLIWRGLADGEVLD